MNPAHEQNRKGSEAEPKKTTETPAPVKPNVMACTVPESMVPAVVADVNGLVDSIRC